MTDASSTSATTRGTGTPESVRRSARSTSASRSTACAVGSSVPAGFLRSTNLRGCSCVPAPERSRNVGLLWPISNLVSSKGAANSSGWCDTRYAVSAAISNPNSILCTIEK